MLARRISSSSSIRASSSGPSSSGKMAGVANSSGFKEFPGDLIGNLYIGRKSFYLRAGPAGPALSLEVPDG